MMFLFPRWDMLVPWRVPQHKWPSNFLWRVSKEEPKKGIPFLKINQQKRRNGCCWKYRPSLFGGPDCNFCRCELFVFKLQGCKCSFQGLGGRINWFDMFSFNSKCKNWVDPVDDIPPKKSNYSGFHKFCWLRVAVPKAKWRGGRTIGELLRSNVKPLKILLTMILLVPLFPRERKDLTGENGMW